jgi:hypothetical protein
VSHFAMEHAQKMIRARRAVPANIEAPGAEGDAIRAEVGRDAYELNVQQFCAAGLNFGYFYTGSPILAQDDEPPPAYTMGGFTESTVPGCRAPHFWLDDGRSLYDAFGPGYTLLRFDPRTEVETLLAAAKARRLPLVVLDVRARDEIPAAYGHKLVLCRTDQHVAWRADTVPAQAEELVDLLCGEPEPSRAGQ